MTDMTGVILAAGTGSRLGALTDDLPKVLVPVAGAPLLAYDIAFLRAVGVARIGVLAGFHADSVRAWLDGHAPDAVIAENQDYRMQNALSFRKALASFSGDLLICDGDYIRSASSAKLVAAPRVEVTLYVSTAEAPDPDFMRIQTDADGTIRAMDKRLPTWDAHSAGMVFVPDAARAAMLAAVDAAVGQKTAERARLEDALLAYAAAGGALRAVDIGPHDWLEIDTPEELMHAERELRHRPQAYVAPSGTVAVRCPVCGSAAESAVDDRTVEGRRVRNVQCLRCGHVYLSPRESAAVYDAYYRVGFSENCNSVTGDADPAALAASAEAKTDRIFRFLEPELRPGMRVLEIGSGYGNLLARIRQRTGAEVTGIEPDPVGPVVARAAFGLEIVRQTLAEFLAGWDGRQFDLILMHHVLEHFLEPDEVGEALGRLLAPGGRVYIGVPNVAAMTFTKRLFFRFPHVSNFTPYTLFLLLWRHDMKIVRLDDLSRPLSAIVAWRSDAAGMVPTLPLVRAGLPPGRVRRSIARRDAYHAVRLFVRDHRGRFLPAPLKRALKALIRR